MPHQKPKRKYEVSFVPKGTKMHVTEYVLAINPADARVQMRLAHGFLKFEVKECAA